MTVRQVPNVRRVVLAINTLEAACDALELAAEFAALLKVELKALLVDDINLLKLAELPFAKELDRTSGVMRPLDLARLTGTLESNTVKLKRLLDEESRRRRVTVSTRVVRGHYVVMAREEAGAQDILVLGETARRYALGGERGVRRLDRSAIWVYFDGSEGARRSLALAVVLADSMERQLIIVLDRDVDQTAVVDELAALSVDQAHTHYRLIHSADQAGIAAEMRLRGCAVLILPRGSEEFDRDAGTLGLVRGPRILV